MSSLPLFDAAGRRRSPATMPGYHAGREPRNKGRTYPADPSTVEEIVAVMRQAGEDRHGLRARALIVVLWRAALRIQEVLSLTETDLDQRRGSVIVQAGKGGYRREVGIDSWALSVVRPWLTERAQLPIGPLFCVIDGPTRGVRAWSSASVRAEFRHLAAKPPLSPGPRETRRSPAPGARPTRSSHQAGAARHLLARTRGTLRSRGDRAGTSASVGLRHTPSASTRTETCIRVATQLPPLLAKRRGLRLGTRG
jgi:integrase